MLGMRQSNFSFMFHQDVEKLAEGVVSYFKCFILLKKEFEANKGKCQCFKIRMVGM